MGEEEKSDKINTFESSFQETYLGCSSHLTTAGWQSSLYSRISFHQLSTTICPFFQIQFKRLLCSIPQDPMEPGPLLSHRSTHRACLPHHTLGKGGIESN